MTIGKCNSEDAEKDGASPLFDRSQEIKRSNKKNWIFLISNVNDV